MVNLRDYQTIQRSLTPRWEGPFKIKEKIGEVSFRLDLPTRFRAYHPVFHASKLIKYNKSSIPGQQPLPAEPEIIEEPEYEVENILDH